MTKNRFQGPWKENCVHLATRIKIWSVYFQRNSPFIIGWWIYFSTLSSMKDACDYRFSLKFRVHKMRQDEYTNENLGFIHLHYCKVHLFHFIIKSPLSLLYIMAFSCYWIGFLSNPSINYHYRTFLFCDVTEINY